MPSLRPLRWRRVLGVAAPLAFAVSLVIGTGLAGADGLSAAPGGPQRSPLSAGTLASIAFHSGALTGASGGSRASAAAPAATILPNVQASGGGQPTNEVPITANSVNGNQLMSAANDYNCSTLTGVYNSSDGGATWLHHCLPSVSGGSGCGDPNVAYDRNGVAYALGIQDCSTGGIVIQSSTDNGATWGTAHQAFTSLFSGGFTDKEWTEVDTNASSPFVNCLYTSWTDFNSSETGSRTSVAHSCDGGTTWTRVAVDTLQSIPKLDQFTDLAIASDGTVYVTWMQCQTSGAAGDCGGTSVQIKWSKSTDGGNTWTAPATIHNAQLVPDSCFCAYYGNVPGTSERVNNIPVVDLDASGKIYVVDYNYTGTFMQARVTTSTDGGTTWSATVNINPTSTKDQFFPWLDVNATGTVGVVYLQRNGPNYAPFATVSTNGGATWKGNRKVTTVESQFSKDGFGGGFMGDYIGGIWVGNTFHMSWPDTRNGSNCQDWTGGVSL